MHVANDDATYAK